MDTLWGSFMNYLVLYAVVDEVRTVFVNGATSRPPSNQRDFAVGRETFAHTIWLFCGIRSENSFSTKAWGLENFFECSFFLKKLSIFLWSEVSYHLCINHDSDELQRSIVVFYVFIYFLMIASLDIKYDPDLQEKCAIHLT